MKMKKKILLLAAAMILNVSVARAETMETLATQAILVDANTGTVLLDKGAATRMPTSSMSKVMTMYMAFEDLKRGHINLEDKITVSERAWRMGGSKMFIQVGDQIKVEDLIRGVIIQSGNDASVALAEGVAGTEEAFADAMNIRAKEIGLNDSHFMNATGWPDPDHYSTPRDLAILAYRLISDFPEYYHYYSEKEFVFNKIKQQNRNPLLTRMQGADGVKTGHTDAAGYGLIGSALREGRRMIVVLNGLKTDKDRADEAVRIMEWGFRNFESRKLLAKDEVVDEADVWLGSTPHMPLVAERDLNVILPKSRRNELKMTVNYNGPLKAPIKKGEEVGKLRIEVPDQEPVEMKLLAGATIERKGFFGRAKDRLSYLLTGEK